MTPARSALALTLIRMATTALGALCVPFPVRAACPATPEQMMATVKSATDAFAANKSDDFRTARLSLSEEVKCLTATPSPAQAAAVHEVQALGGFLDQDIPATQAALQAMHESDPTLSLSEELAPAGRKLAKSADEARLRPPSPRVPHNSELDVIVDGRAAQSLPTTRPALVVVRSWETGRVLWSDLLPAGASIPPNFQTNPTAPSAERAVISVMPDTGVSKATIPLEKQAPRRRAWPAFVAAGGCVAAAGVLGGLYVPANARVNTAGDLIAEGASDEEWVAAFERRLTANEVYALDDRARNLGIGSVVAGGLGLGFAVVGIGTVIKW